MCHGSSIACRVKQCTHVTDTACCLGLCTCVREARMAAAVEILHSATVQLLKAARHTLYEVI